jgi:hypothetical protein
MRTHNFFNNTDRDFYCEKNQVSQVYTYIPKIQKKILKTLLSSMINLSSVKSTPRSLFGLFIKKNLRSEIQNSLTNSGLPIHKLELKVNCIVLPTTCKIVAWA